MFCDLPALAAVNEELGVDVDRLVDRCKTYRKVLLKRRHEIVEKIKSQVIDRDSTVGHTLTGVHDERQTIVKLKTDIEQLKSKYAKFKKETENIRSLFQNLINDLKYNCNRMMYLSCVRSVVYTSNKIRTDLMGKSANKGIASYTILCKLNCAMDETPCKNLFSYINNVINYWHCILERYYSQEFEIILKKMNWPLTTTESIEFTKLDNFKQSFQSSASNLMKIQLPKTNCNDFNEPSNSLLTEHFSNISLPIAMLIVPFRKRFFFHFTGKKQTNKPDKPEWFLSRVLSWIRDYREFIIEWLGPVYKENNRSIADCQNEFIIGLLQSVVIKLDSDLSYFQLEDVVFSHIVDESLAFEHELKKVYGYPNDFPSVTEVLSQAHIFFKWINMERKYANIKIETILNDPHHWKVLIEDSQYIMTVASDSFLTLLNTMSDRYSILRQPRHKLQFLKLQTDLLEEFKQKIINDSNENQLDEHLIEILCTLHHIVYTLNNWGTNVQFLSLLNHKCELENEVRNRSESENTQLLDTAETAFDDSISSFNVRIDRLLNRLCENIMTKIKHDAKEYKRDKCHFQTSENSTEDMDKSAKQHYNVTIHESFNQFISKYDILKVWHIMNSVSNENKYSITDSGWVMYESFTENMNTLNKKLPATLFNKCWPTLATTFSTFIFNDVLLANMFNKGGAQHLKCDVQYKLLPIISKYTAKPNIYIEKLLEGCKVLCFEPHFKPVILTRYEVSEILLRRIENGNSIELS